MNRLFTFLHEKLRIWHFLILIIISVPLSGWLLRQNNLTMLELRDKVLQVDEETGDIAQIEPHIKELGNYILSHMNTNTGLIYLPGAYNAEVERIRLEAEQSGSANGEIYAEAQRVCEDPNVLLTARAQCVQDYVIANAAPGTDAITELRFPDVALFSYSFSSPRWSPDLAGLSVLFAGLNIVIFGVLLVTRVIGPFLGRVIDRDPLE